MESPDAVYYDLVLNPERFTGYTGPSAVNVWKLVYDQNCFKWVAYEFLFKFEFNNTHCHPYIVW